MEGLVVRRLGLVPFGFLIITMGLLTSCAENQAHHNASSVVSTPRFLLEIEHDNTTLLRQEQLDSDLAAQALDALNAASEEVNRLFSYTPEDRILLRILPPNEFRAYTGAPEWTSAMFFRGEITIPRSASHLANPTELRQALRHEYTHALVAQLSNYRCPAWIDEGLAQIIEGQPNPLVGPALRRWLTNNDPMPFTWLEGGFTVLHPELVPAAYGQSLFATRHLVDSYGFKNVVKYLTALGKGYSNNDAFSVAFKHSLPQFENDIDHLAMRWAASNQINP